MSIMERLEGYTSLNAFLVPDPKVPFSDWYNYDRGFRQRITIGYIIAKAFGEIAERNLVIRRCGREKSPLRC